MSLSIGKPPLSAVGTAPKPPTLLSMGGVPVHASVTVPITIPQFPDSNTIDSDSDEDDDTMRFKFQGFRGTEEDVERIIELVEYNFIKVSKHFEDSESRDKATAALPLCNTGGDAKEFLKKLPRGKRTSWTSLCEELRSRFPVGNSPNLQTEAMDALRKLKKGG